MEKKIKKNGCKIVCASVVFSVLTIVAGDATNSNDLISLGFGLTLFAPMLVSLWVFSE